MVVFKLCYLSNIFFNLYHSPKMFTKLCHLKKTEINVKLLIGLHLIQIYLMYNSLEKT
jgi:hypothetical protein